MIEPYYQEDGITVYCGDCREILPNVHNVELLLTDPQYQLADGRRATTMNATAGRGKNKMMRMIETQAKDWGVLEGDGSPFEPEQFLGFPKIILWGAIHYANKLPNSTSWLIWDKRGDVASDDNADAEMAWSNLGGPARIHKQLWKGICREGEENIGVQGSKLHPFQKPIRLMKWCIEISKTTGIILDPFCGSGTTLVAAKHLGRKAVGVEISEKYCEIAVKRLAQKELNFPPPERRKASERRDG